MLTAKQLLILSLLHLNVHSWRKLQVKLQNLTYSYVEDYGYMNATLSSDGYLSLFMRPSMDIEHVFLTVMVKFTTDDTGNFDIEYMNKTVDMCKFSHDARYEPLIQLFFKILSQKIHVPQRCPIKKNDLYSFTNFTFETEKFPPIIHSNNVFFYVKYSRLKDRHMSKILDLSVIGHPTYKN